MYVVVINVTDDVNVVLQCVIVLSFVENVHTEVVNIISAYKSCQLQ